ncbi:IS110 family transposase [Bacteroidia bacterium]|nr:IS110 family transposase [Bacteroidia bacterium]
MKKKLFIGIDFSKKTFDVSVMHSLDLEGVSYRQFGNTREGCEEMLKWMKTQTVLPQEEWLFCGEHTGLCDVLVSNFLVKQGLFMWLENPMQIKSCTGIKREKSDRIDSRDIALYACRYQDKQRAYHLPDKDLKALDELLSYRERLVSAKHTFVVSANELRGVYQRDVNVRHIYEDSRQEIERLNKKIKATEALMKKLIAANESLNETYQLVTSIKGIALINAVAFIVLTENFTRFETSRQFACYAGMAPFGRQSGTALNTHPHVSHLANKKIKKLLTQAALCAMRHDKNMRQYYERKRAEGKHEGVIINNVRNKLIHCIFAVVRSKVFYQEDYLNPLKKAIA